MSEAPLKPSVFAVWGWKWWVWCAVTFSMAVAYLISAEQFAYLLHRLGITQRHFLLVAIYFAPVQWLYLKSETFRQLFDWQEDLMEFLFGPM